MKEWIYLIKKIKVILFLVVVWNTLVRKIRFPGIVKEHLFRLQSETNDNDIFCINRGNYTCSEWSLITTRDSLEEEFIFLSSCSSIRKQVEIVSRNYELIDIRNYKLSFIQE